MNPPTGTTMDPLGKVVYIAMSAVTNAVKAERMTVWGCRSDDCGVSHMVQS